MRLTAFSDFSIRTLIYLALRPERQVTINDISKAYGISGNHLMKVVHQLAMAGDVTTTRGQRGGLRLGRPAADINLGVVIRRTEPDLHLAACFGAEACCAIQRNCVLAQALGEALTAFLAVLDRYTLADLVTQPAALARLLDIQLGEPPRQEALAPPSPAA